MSSRSSAPAKTKSFTMAKVQPPKLTTKLPPLLYAVLRDGKITQISSMPDPRVGLAEAMTRDFGHLGMAILPLAEGKVSQ